MTGLSRHELKEDKFKTAFDEYEQFIKQHYREILLTVGVALVVVGAVLGLRQVLDRQESAANAKLGAALETFNAYVGNAAPGTLGPGAQSYITANEKYKKALIEFMAAAEVSGWENVLPRPQAVRLAQYYVGLCQAEVGEDADAVKTLTQAAGDRDAEIASLANFALAGEMAKTGKAAEAEKIYQSLIDRPTTSVPKATVELALAGSLRDSQPAQARQIYERMEKEYATDSLLAGALKQALASLPR